MKKTALSFVLAIAAMGSLFAQKDSSYYDLGYTTLDKRFTQSITVKGSDLEKMPFVNLGDAIGAWFYGSYTEPGMVIYIVDGNPVSDVNTYSIFDIEEVTLVQNAAALVGTAGSQQEVVLVKTKRGNGGRGLLAAGQLGLVDGNGGGVKTNTSLYHHYYLGVYANKEKMSYGISADWVRDIEPVTKDSRTEVRTPFNLQRWRLNGYFNWRPDSRNSIDVVMGYAPQRIAEDVTGKTSPTMQELSNNAHAHVLSPQVRWHSELPAGFTNDLQGTYLATTGNGDYYE
ncbi:MAG TPA: hypothetical protein VKQ52_16795, partial [Puia sp.]|nr:hypothetical protein [Puia sp.]